MALSEIGSLPAEAATFVAPTACRERVWGGQMNPEVQAQLTADIETRINGGVFAATKPDSNPFAEIASAYGSKRIRKTIVQALLAHGLKLRKGRDGTRFWATDEAFESGITPHTVRNRQEEGDITNGIADAFHRTGETLRAGQSGTQILFSGRVDEGW